MNVECRRKEFYRFLLSKKTERSDSTLRHSAVRYSIFCGSQFNPSRLIIKKPGHFGAVSYERRLWPEKRPV